MSKTFSCPHCSKEYPRSAALIGRKVRCTACKSVIQLMPDGSVTKIATEAVKAKAQGTRANFNQRSLTRRQKKQVEKTVTRSIERGRSLLNEAAKSAVDKIDAAEAATKGSPRKTKSQPLESEPKASSQKQARQQKASQERIVRSAYDSKYQSKYPLLLIACIALSGIFFFIFSSEPTADLAALRLFASPVDESVVKHPLRMPAYRDRMWLHTRDGIEAPPIVLNAEKAQIQFCERVKWSQMIQACNVMLKEMSLMRNFGMWVRSDKQVRIERLWESFKNKNNLAMFYELLGEQGIDFIHCERIPDMLLKKGFSPRAVYVASLLLAGTGDRKGAPCRDFGLASDEFAQTLEVYEFQGNKSMTLIDRQNEYAVTGGSHYSGLIAGFLSTSQATAEYKVLDVRFAKTMDAFYEDHHNPLRMINNAARLRMMSEHVVPQAVPGPEMGVEE